MPLGLFFSVRITAAFSSNRIREPSSLACSWCLSLLGWGQVAFPVGEEKLPFLHPRSFHWQVWRAMKWGLRFHPTAIRWPGYTRARCFRIWESPLIPIQPTSSICRSAQNSIIRLPATTTVSRWLPAAPSGFAHVFSGLPPRVAPRIRRISRALLGVLPPQSERRVEVSPGLGPKTGYFVGGSMRRGVEMRLDRAELRVQPRQPGGRNRI